MWRGRKREREMLSDQPGNARNLPLASEEREGEGELDIAGLQKARARERPQALPLWSAPVTGAVIVVASRPAGQSASRRE